MCLSQGPQHNDVGEARTRDVWSWVKHSTTEPLRSNTLCLDGSTISLASQKALIHIQWATLVTHHFFRAHIFWQKCSNRTFPMIIYLLTFYLFDDIEKNNWNHSCESFCYVKGNFDKNAKMHVQAERPYFLFLLCASHYPWWSLWQKNTKNNYFIQVKPPFSVVEFSNTVTFWRNARFDVILTSVTIIKQGFLRKLFCYESLVDIEVSKH